MVLVQLQEALTPAVLLRFGAVSRLAFISLFEASPERTHDERDWTFEMLSLSVTAKDARAVVLDDSALGADASIESAVAKMHG
jgi:hypothetical protein